MSKAQSTSKSWKYVVPASMIGGGIVLGSMFSPIGLSGAQESEDSTSSVEAESGSTASDDAASDDSASEGRRGRIDFAALEELGLTTDDIKAGQEAGQTLVETAAAAGISEADLLQAITDAASDRLATAVAEGKIDAEKAAEIEAGLTEKITERINTVHEARVGGTGKGGKIRANLTETLGELGLDADELKTGREAGLTVAEIAAEAGVSESDLVDALIASAEERLAAATESGKIDAEKAAEIAENLEDRVNQMVNRDPADRPERSERSGRGGQSDAVAPTDA